IRAVLHGDAERGRRHPGDRAGLRLAGRAAEIEAAMEPALGLAGGAPWALAMASLTGRGRPAGGGDSPGTPRTRPPRAPTVARRGRRRSARQVRLRTRYRACRRTRRRIAGTS